jgi:UDP-glucose 4-epimerase
VRIVVTGADGFIGSHLLPELEQAGHDVQADLNEVRTPGWRCPAGTDVVVHLAALVGRENCEHVHDRRAVVAVNVGGTINVARACAEAGARLVYVSSSEATWGGNLYGLTKRWAEDAARLYAPDGLQILRLFMPYGPGHPPGAGRAALTNFLWAAMHQEELLVHRGTSRPWCWIGDTVRAIRMVAEDGGPGLWNVGRSDNVADTTFVARSACALAGAPLSLIREVDPPGNVLNDKYPDTTRLRGIGWQPEVGLDEGMQITMDWLRTLDRVAA